MIQQKKLADTMAKIYIHTGPVHTGKTTRLLNWAKHKENLFGFLTPDIAGLRKLLILPSKDVLRFELSEAEMNTLSSEEIVEVGKFKFDRRAFELASQIIDGNIPEGVEWILVDEIGKLELNELGFYQTIGSLLDRFNRQEIEANIIFIVRDYLLEAVIEKFKINDWHHFNDSL